MKRLLIIVGIVAIILSVPLISMQFGTSVDWDLADFIVAGSILFITGLGIDLVLRKLRDSTYKIPIIIVIIILLLLLWAELGVGLFGSPLAGD